MSIRKAILIAHAIQHSHQKSLRGGLFVQLFRVLLHLQGPPHLMGKARHVSSKSGKEVFQDVYNPNHRVVMKRRKGK